MKTVKAKLEENKLSAEEVTAFEKGAAAFAKKIVANFKDFEFYTGESMNPDGMVALLNYRVGRNHAPTLTGDLTILFFPPTGGWNHSYAPVAHPGLTRY